MTMFRTCPSLLILGIVGTAAFANDATVESFQRDFNKHIHPVLQQHCVSCHDAETAEAELDLTRFRRFDDVTDSHQLWLTILQRVEAGEMPPADADSQPSDEQRARFVQWIRNVRQFEAQRTAGDPGPLSVRRLSNAEYDYSIRDLTGVDIRPTQTFPIDPANESGFDNTSESLRMSPALLTKYLEAARKVVDHLVLAPAGIRFAPHPVATDTDRDKYCVKRIVAFYQRQPTSYADYFFAAWSYRHRAALGKPAASLSEIAAEHSVSPKYLATIWNTLEVQAFDKGPLATLHEQWRGLPVAGMRAQAREACQAMEAYVVRTRKRFEPEFDNLQIKDVHKGTQAFVLWKNKQYATHRRKADYGFLSDESRSRLPGDVKNPTPQQREAFIAACDQFCDLFPDAFYIAERGRDYLDKPKDEQEKGRLLSAGFHSMMGYFRDDGPLYELILDERGQGELDRLWQELDFITSAPQRQYQGFLWFDRTDSRFMRDPQFDFARPEDKQSLTEPMIKRLSEVYLAKAKANGGDEVPLRAIEDYFQDINAQIRWVEQARLAAEDNHLRDVLALAAKAYRRPLTAAEQNGLREFYRQLRDVDQLSHEEAIQDTIVSVLMSPHFCYRLDLHSDSDLARPLNDLELASRLSFFLWSSIPDAELLDHARAGTLTQTEVLLQQTRRMMDDDRVRALAMEFAGNWLDFRRFQQHNSVDRERFPAFDDDLRNAMFEEPVRFFVDLVQRDRSVLDLLYADRTFVNATLANHYGITGIEIPAGQWRQIDDAGRYGRGGLLPMAVFLTQNSPGLRTSPVKRGYWVVRRLLGERIPPPPPDVPELPADESQLGEKTLRETLAMHRAHQACAGCHDRFDSIGIAFEGFGPIGERRKIDLGGRAIDTLATFPDGSRRNGVAELRSYLQEQRETEFLDNLCRKLLSYALGRTLQLSDEALLQSMRGKATADDHRFGVFVETIVTSPQFLNKRGRHARTAADINAIINATESDEQ
jgi:hypothetical protein